MGAGKTSTSIKGIGIGYLVFLFFAGFGGWAITSMALQVSAWNRARAWVECPCLIESAEFNVDSSGESHLRASYRYQYGGQQYLGHEVWLRDETDDEGEFWGNAYRSLKSHAGSNRSFRCFVDPAAPSVSVLYRNLRVELVIVKSIFGFLFGGIGCGGILLLMNVQRSHRRQVETAIRNPTEPWRWDSSIKDGRIKPSMEWIFWAFVAIFWNTVSFPPTVAILQRTNHGSHLDYLILVFPAFGIFAMATAMKSIHHRLKYGKPEITMQPWPYRLGQELRVCIEFPKAFPRSRNLKAMLKVTEVVITDDNPETLFETTCTSANAGRTVEFVLPIQGELPRSRQVLDTSEQKSARWQLTIVGTDSRFDFRAVYVLPVFERSL